MSQDRYAKSFFPYVMVPLTIYRKPQTRKVLKTLQGFGWWIALVIVAKDGRNASNISGRLEIGGEPITREDVGIVTCWEPIPDDFVARLIKAGWLEEQDDGCLAIPNWQEWFRTPSKTAEGAAFRKQESRAKSNSFSKCHTDVTPSSHQGHADVTPLIQDQSKINPIQDQDQSKIIIIRTMRIFWMIVHRGITNFRPSRPR